MLPTIVSQKNLAVVLSQLVGFSKPKTALEQYETPSEIAAGVLWHAHMQGQLEDKTVADLGAGTGILGIGALLLYAKKVFFVEKDYATIELLQKNLDKLEIPASDYTILNTDISNFKENVDIIVQNPPFGTKTEHADKLFLEQAFKSAPQVYSLHKSTTGAFVKAMCRDHGYKIKEELRFSYPLRASMNFHKKQIERIEVSCFVMERIHTKDNSL